MAEAPTYRNALALETMLLEYRLESVLGAGGFGMTYLAWDTNLEKHVAIKEYLPGELAIRALDGSVVPVNTDSEFNYKWGLDRFIQEARTLAKFSHPNIVHVNRYFEANGTSYMVMDYEAGESLHQYLRRVPKPTEATLKGILMPILDGLQAVHQNGFLHRDIKPSNVFMRANGIPVLLDFGSARMAGRISKSMTAIVSPGYAPLEQYSNEGNQGPWSDIYALSGVIFRAVTGANPPDAIKRMTSDSVPQTLDAERARYSERFLKAIEWGMTLDERIRPQRIADWRDLFLGRAPMTAMGRGASIPTLRPATTAAAGVPTVRAGELRARNADAAALRRTVQGESQASGALRWLIAGGILAIILALAAIAWRHHQGRQQTTGVGVTQTTPPLLSDPQTAPQIAPQSESRSEPESRLVAQPVPAIPQAEAVATPEPAPVSQTVERTEAAPTVGMTGETQIPLLIRKEFQSADRDGDGYLTRNEVRGKFPFIEQHFSQTDVDRDGRISAGELLQLRKKQQSPKFAR